jgi:NCS1 family nucleobase:cation symporter-1
MSTSSTTASGASEETGSALAVEQNGLNVIPESERKGSPRDLFWPWCAANISVFGISYGSYVLSFGISRNQALVATIFGVILSFLLVGLVSLAGKQGSAPTLVLSRAPFGVRGNALPAAVSYLLLVGWETVLVSLATFATATVFGRLGWGDGNATKVSAFIVVAAIIVAAGVLGFDAIMRLQKYLTILTLIVTIGYIMLTLDEISGSAVSGLDSGGGKAVFGAFVLVLTGFGISWVNSAADYSRYLPRGASGRGITGWVTFGGSLPVVVLVVYGVFLAGSDPDLSAALAIDPIGALTPTLPEWFLVPFIVVAVAGLVSGAVLDIYSSGLSLLSLGLPAPRWAASALDGAIMIVGTIYIVWIADDFLTPFMAFLITLGVPISAWCGTFLADLLLRRKDYDDDALYDPRGRYGAVNLVGVGSMVIGTAVGWGLVVSSAADGYPPEAAGFGWQGYLLEPLGLGPKLNGPWTYANLGVLVALVLPFVLYLVFGRSAVRRQESSSAPRHESAEVG